MNKEEIRRYNDARAIKRFEIAMKDEWTDADRLKIILYEIEPYSKWWRWGMVRALRRAIKLLETETKGENDE